MNQNNVAHNPSYEFLSYSTNHLKNGHIDFHVLSVLISSPQLTFIAGRVCLTAAGDFMRFQSYEVFGY